VLLPAFAQRYDDIRVKLIAVGSGEALALGRRRDADVLLVHSPSDEAQFMSAGHGRSRHVVMWNDYVIAGPSTDVAGVRDAATVAEALGMIAVSGAQFISRGDSSGTHRKELMLRRMAGIENGTRIEVGQGMGEALAIASERGAYTLADRATFIALSATLRLAIVFEGDPLLSNPYSVITVAGSRGEREADLFAAWLQSSEARQLIDSFGSERFGRPLFHTVEPTVTPAAAGQRD
jgi:tungstate transport system substrate-binding protein